MKRVIILAGICCAVGCGPGASGNSSLPPVTVLSSDSANQQSARVSPDGSRFFWWEPGSPGAELWTAGTDLKNPVRLPVHSVTNSLTLLWSRDGSQIALASSDSSLQDVAVIPAAGGPPRLITHSTGFAIPVGWNPDGDRITYMASAAGTGGGTLQSFVTSIKHGGTAPLIPGALLPTFGLWSPDGSRIAYTTGNGSDNTLWVADSTGRNVRQLTTDGFELMTSDQPWSPDGKWIAYESSRTGTTDIWIAPVDSGKPRQLTHDLRNDRTPVWSPDGKWIAFISDRGKQTDVWVVPMAGGPEIRVTDNSAEEQLMGWLSGSRLAFLTGTPQAGIWSISLAGSAEHRLTPDSLVTGPPELSPDGKQIAFRIDRGGGISDVAVMPVAGGPIRTLVQGGANNFLTWSPDGTRLAFLSDRGGTTDVWIADVATGALKQMENWPSNEFSPAWSGDGSALYFLSDRDTRLGDVWKVAATGGEPVRVTKQGTFNNVVARRGHAELYASIVSATGQIQVVQVNADGSLSTIWQRANAFPTDFPFKGDSIIIAVSGAGGGGFTFYLIPASGGGEGRALLKTGRPFGGLSEDGTQILTSTDGTRDLALLNRGDGTTRRLTSTRADAPEMTPDGKTVLFQLVRPSRRIAIADLSKLLNSNK